MTACERLLGTNSLLEASVFGRRAGNAVAEFVNNGTKLAPVTGDPAEKTRQRIEGLLSRDGSELVEHIAQALKTTMTNNCGVFRTGEKLEEALGDVKGLQDRFQSARVMDKSKRFNTDLLAAIEAEHLLTFSEVIVAGALERKECRGAHWRTDHPQRDDEQWLRHTVAHKNGDDGPKLTYKPVSIDWQKYPPQERKY